MLQEENETILEKVSFENFWDNSFILWKNISCPKINGPELPVTDKRNPPISLTVWGLYALKVGEVEGQDRGHFISTLLYV